MLICVAVGVWLAWVRPAQLPGAVAVTMGLLLLLSTASGLQYLTWAAAAMFVIGFWEGVAYSCLLGWTAILGYQGRSAVRWSETVLQLGTAGWFVLAICLVSGVRRILAAPPDGPRRPPPNRHRSLRPALRIRSVPPSTDHTRAQLENLP